MVRWIIYGLIGLLISSSAMADDSPEDNCPVLEGTWHVSYVYNEYGKPSDPYEYRGTNLMVKVRFEKKQAIVEYYGGRKVVYRKGKQPYKSDKIFFGTAPNSKYIHALSIVEKTYDDREKGCFAVIYDDLKEERYINLFKYLFEKSE